MTNDEGEMTLAILTYIIRETQANLRSARNSIVRAETTWTGLKSVTARSVMASLGTVKKEIVVIETRMAELGRELAEVKEARKQND